MYLKLCKLSVFSIFADLHKYLVTSMRTFYEEGQLIISFFVSEERKKKMSYLRLGNVVRTCTHS